MGRMAHTSTVILALTFVAVMSMGVGSCVSVKPSTVTLDVGQTAQLRASSPTDNSFTWSTTNAQVATVNTAGLVTAQGGGTAFIIATGDSTGQAGRANVTVRPPVPPPDPPDTRRPVATRSQFLNLNLVAFHHADSPSYISNCTLCHGGRLNERAAHGGVDAVHSVMDGYFGAGESRCQRCHSEGVDLITRSTNVLRGRMFENGWCSSPNCHGPNSAKPFYLVDR